MNLFEPKKNVASVLNPLGFKVLVIIYFAWAVQFLYKTGLITKKSI